MKKKSLNLNTGHIPIIRHQVRWGLVFIVSILLIVIFQSCIVIININKDLDFSKIQWIVSIATIIFGILIMLLQTVLLLKNIYTIKQIKKEGSYELTTVSWLEGGFVKFIKIVSYITLIITSMFAFGFMTSVVLEYVYFKEMNYYLPAVLLFLFANNYSCKNIENQILLEQDF